MESLADGAVTIKRKRYDGIAQLKGELQYFFFQLWGLNFPKIYIIAF